MFKALGILIAAYTAYAAFTGQVFAKSGPWGRQVSRQAQPGYFWSVIAIYAALALALITIF